jgi:beta-lactamase regulating signal transducer with metallopeptidase domain
MIFLDILTRYVLPIIYDSFVVLVLVLFFLFIFRIKDSNMRILFFFLPLIKPFIVIMEMVDINKIYYSDSPKGFAGIRFPDPTNMIRIDNTPIELISDVNYRILFIIIMMISIILIARWISIGIFYRKLAFEDRVGRREVPEVFLSIDNYTQKTKSNKPEVSLTHRNYISPFVIGIKRSILVLPPRLLDELEPGEKDVLIKHELSHIKRRDGLIGWIAIILRDINFFNPFAYIAYYLIRSEQERACDKLVLKYSETSPVETAKNILNSILKLKEIIRSPNRPFPIGGSPFSPIGFVSYKRLEHRVTAIKKTDIYRLSMRVFPKILLYFLFIILLMIQIVYTIKIGETLIFLR